MADTAQALYKFNGVPVSEWEDVQVSPQGGESQLRQTINPKNRSPGTMHGQEPGYEITARADIVKGSEEIDYDKYIRTKEKFTVEEEFDTFSYIYQNCTMQPVGHGTDTATKAGKRDIRMIAEYRRKITF